MRRFLSLAFACAFVSPAFAADPAQTELAAAAKAFYDVYTTLHPSDGIPDAATRAKFAPVVSPGLDALFGQGEEAEARYAKATKSQAPPLVEGDIFTPNFEGATSSSIGECKSDQHGGYCAVLHKYEGGNDRPAIWMDTVYLVRTPEGLRVDDIVYGGNGGRLTETLKDAIRDGNDFTR